MIKKRGECLAQVMRREKTQDKEESKKSQK